MSIYRRKFVLRILHMETKMFTMKIWPRTIEHKYYSTREGCEEFTVTVPTPYKTGVWCVNYWKWINRPRFVHKEEFPHSCSCLIEAFIFLTFWFLQLGAGALYSSKCGNKQTDHSQLRHLRVELKKKMYICKAWIRACYLLVTGQMLLCSNETLCLSTTEESPSVEV